MGYEAGGTPPTPGGGVNPWGGNFGIFSPRTPQPQNNAIGAGESLGVFIGFKNGMTYANFLAAATNQSNFRLIAHIEGVVNGQSIWSIGDNNSLIPTPGAAALLADAGLLATRRRR